MTRLVIGICLIQTYFSTYDVLTYASSRVEWYLLVITMHQIELYRQKYIPWVISYFLKLKMLLSESTAHSLFSIFQVCGQQTILKAYQLHESGVDKPNVRDDPHLNHVQKLLFTVRINFSSTFLQIQDKTTLEFQSYFLQDGYWWWLSVCSKWHYIMAK